MRYNIIFFVVLNSVPIVCKATKDVYGSTGQYVKTICKVDNLRSWSGSKLFCENNGMKLVYSNEYLNDLIPFASSTSNGNSVWVDGRNGCSLLVPTGSSAFFNLDNQVCYPEYNSLCEYYSEFRDKFFSSINHQFFVLEFAPLAAIPPKRSKLKLLL